MAEVIKYSFSTVVAGGPRVNHSAQLEVDAYGMLEVTVPDKSTLSGKATADVQPLDSGVQFLLVTAGSYETLTYKVDGGSAQTLDGPLLLIGEGAVQLLGTTQKQFEFTNTGDDAVLVNILVGRDATAP